MDGDEIPALHGATQALDDLICDKLTRRSVTRQHFDRLLFAHANDARDIIKVKAVEVADLRLNEDRSLISVHMERVLYERLLSDLESPVERRENPTLVVGRLEGRLDSQINRDDQVWLK